jgi:hypothetical protein
MLGVVEMYFVFSPSLVGPNILLTALLQNTLKISSSLLQYKTRGKITHFVYINSTVKVYILYI